MTESRRDDSKAADEEQLIERLLEQYDEASASGLSALLPKPAGLSAESYHELQVLARRIDLVNQAARQQDSNTSGTDRSGEPAPGDPFAGETIGRFRVLRELGRGGYGIVFLALDQGIGRLVAIKLPRPEVLLTPELRGRFLREAQAAGRINHPHVLPVHEAAEDAGMCYLVTPYCRGLSLAEWFVDRGPVPAMEVAQLGISLADALDCAHQSGVLHRDIKPANILLDLASTEPHADRQTLKQRPVGTFIPKLTDFGLAKLLQSSELETRTGTLVGTPIYMAPEQASGRYADVRTDVFALGVVLYELLTGKLPADASAEAGLSASGRSGLVPPRKLQSSLPRDLEAVVLKCLEPAPADRYPTAAELAEDLRRFVAGKPTAARPVGPARRTYRAMRRRPLVTALILVLAAAFTGLIAGNHWYSSRLDETRTVLQWRDYVRDVRAAAHARSQGAAADAAALLDRYRSGAPGADLRHFEWYALRDALRSTQTIESRHGEAYGVVFSPDGTLLYSGGKDGVIRAWRTDTGKLAYELHGHTSCVNQLDFSPDGTVLASVSCDGTVRLWNVARRKQVRCLVDAHTELTSLAFAHHHPWLAVDTHAGQVQVWDISSGAVIAELGARRENVHIDAIAFSPDDQVLATSTGSDYATLWDTRTWKPIRQEAFFAIALAFVGENSQLVLGPRDWLAELVDWKLDSGQRSSHISKLPTNVQALAGMHHQDVVFAGANDGSLQAFRLSHRINVVFPGSRARVQSICITDDDRHLASADYHGLLHLWDLHRNRIPVTLDSVERIESALFSSDGRWLAIRTVQGEMVLWDIRQRRQVGKLDRFTAHGFSSTGRWLIGTRSDGAATLVSIPDLTPSDSIAYHAPLVSACCSADDRFVAFLGTTGVVEVCDVSQGKVVLHMDLPAENAAGQSLALSPEGSRLILLDEGNLPDHAIEVPSALQVPLPFDLSFIASSAVYPTTSQRSPDGRWRLQGRPGIGDFELQETARGEIVAHLSHREVFSHSHYVWTPDGARLLVATRLGGLVVVDPESGEQLCELDSPLGSISSPLVCSDNGERVMAFTVNERGTGGFIHIWNAPRDNAASHVARR